MKETNDVWRMTNAPDNIERTETSDEPQSPLTQTQQHTSAPVSPDVPQPIGEYRIKRAIASGGIEAVYEPTQE